MKHGHPLLQRLYLKRQARGERTPLDEAPDIPEDAQLAWRAFNQLHASRPVGMGAMPLPLSDIEAWLNIHGITVVEDRIDLYTLVKALDESWLSIVRSKQQESETEREPQPNGDSKETHRGGDRRPQGKKRRSRG